VDVVIEIELAGAGQLHDGSPGEQFRDRAGPEQCLIRYDGNVFFNIRIAVAFRKQDRAVLDDYEYSTGNGSPLDCVRQDSVCKRCEVARLQSVWWLRRARRCRLRGRW